MYWKIFSERDHIYHSHMSYCLFENVNHRRQLFQQS